MIPVYILTVSREIQRPEIKAMERMGTVTYEVGSWMVEYVPLFFKGPLLQPLSTEEQSPF